MRAFLATLVAPLAVPLTFAVTILLQDRSAGGPALVVGLFSLAFAYAVTIVIGLPVYLAKRHSGVSLRSAFAIGAAIGLACGVAWPLVLNTSLAGWKLLWFVASCALGGGFAALTFAAIAGHDAPPEQVAGG